MEGWKYVRLKELILEMGDGGTPSTLNKGNYGGNIPWVVVDDVKPDIYNTKDYLTEQGYKNCSAKLWNVGTIILTTGATIGKVGIARVPLCTKQGITGIVLNKNAYNEFIKFWLEANTMQLLRYAQGTTFKEIRTRPLGNLQIKIPSPFTIEGLEEQKRIANILSKVDKAIASVQNSIAASERLKKSLMQNLLTGKMKPDGTFRTPDEFYIDEKFGKVPIGWEVKRVDEVFVIYPTASYSRSMLKEDGECKYIHYGDIHTRFDTFLDISEESLPYITNDMIKKFVLLKDGDIVISDTSEDYDGVGKLVELVNVGDIKVISGLHTLLLRPKTEDFLNGFKGYLFNEERVRLELLKYVTGIKVYSISKNSLSKVLLPIPSLVEQEQIKEKLDAVNNEIFGSKNRIKKLERLKKSLMQNLLTGKIRINQYINCIGG